MKIAISVGDLGGVGIEIALRTHREISGLCEPVYCINEAMLAQASKLLDIKIPSDFKTLHVEGEFRITPGMISKEAGRYSYDSFIKAIEACERKEADALVTMPINKEAWMRAGIKYKGHTDALRDRFKKEAIMMLGCDKLFVALFTEHIPLKDVASSLSKERLLRFLLDLGGSIPNERFGVLALNPHAGDGGALGDEESIIKEAIDEANKSSGAELFFGPLVPDTAFTPHSRENFRYFAAMYHDQGLAPLKALYFDESINVSLNLPIVRTSVDHGTAFDIAYKRVAKTQSYVNAIKSAIEFATKEALRYKEQPLSSS